jgi:hypothetical protein
LAHLYRLDCVGDLSGGVALHVLVNHLGGNATQRI